MTCRAILPVLLWLVVLHGPPQLPAVDGQDEFPPPPTIGTDEFPPPPAIGTGESLPPPAIGTDELLPPPVIGSDESPPPPAIGTNGSPPPPVIGTDESVPPPAIRTDESPPSSTPGTGGSPPPPIIVEPDNCSIAPKMPGYACVSNNSRCVNAASGRGYICNCTQGFQGNPYLADGCKDINECDHPPCFFGDCVNTNGSFTCSCPAGTHGNRTLLVKCKEDTFPSSVYTVIGFIPSLLYVAMLFLIRFYRRQHYFEQHRGEMLSKILKAEGSDFTFFERGDIKTATGSFRKDNIVGEGAHGTVYKGIISVGGTTTTVAVKRCKQIDQSRTEEFVQELVILCRVNHPNIVKLLGCCLHFKVPMLVSEFAQNGTLNDLLHGKPRRHVTLSTRLRIIAETAEALAYLHSREHPTLHGDVKPENILLGEGWVAKVSDFGCSTIDDNIQVVPKGSLAYLDPEFLTDPQITDKTDVHSLGVVLMELLTSKKPVVQGQKHLRIIFQEAMAKGTLGEILDADLTVEEGATRVIRQAAELASRCTAIPGNTRPTMGQVAEELRRLSEEMPECYQTLQALEVPTPGYINESDESECTGIYNAGSVAALSVELAR